MAKGPLFPRGPWLPLTAAVVDQANLSLLVCSQLPTRFASSLPSGGSVSLQDKKRLTVSLGLLQGDQGANQFVEAHWG